MNKVILFDVGNTNIVIACYEAGHLLFTERLLTYNQWTNESIIDEISSVMRMNHIPCDEVEGAIISTVVPSIIPLIQKAMYELYKIQTVVADIDKIDLRTGGYDTSCLGVDRLVDLLAASKKYGSPCVVCDLGTCTTISVLDAHEIFVGGMISAGIQISLDSEAKRTAQLPLLRAHSPGNLIGTDTESCMISGEVIGTAAMIDGLYDRIRAELSVASGADHFVESDLDTTDRKSDENMWSLVITGGLGVFVMPWLKNEAYYEPNLQLDGLEILYQSNKTRGEK